jgi:type IV fimbrial biogenesis protein FimT
VNNKGFTLVELMIVISILGILSAIALPSFDTFLRKRQMVGSSNLFYTTLYLARSEAVKRNSTVTICKSSDGVTCGGSWTAGWLMFEDANSDGVLDGAEVTITGGSLTNGYLLTWSAFGSNSYIRFNKNGMTASHNGTFKFCPQDSNSKFASAVIVSKTARIRVAKDNNQNGIREDASGNDLTC